MKKHFFRTAITAVCLCVVSLVSAQDTYEWDSHGIGFTLPAGFEISTNTDEEFTAGNDQMSFSLIPWDDAEITEEQLGDVVVEIATELEYDDVHDAFDAKVDEFVGVGIYGTKDGVDAVIAAILDKTSGTNIIVIITYAPEFGEAAEDIYYSLYSYEK